MFLTWKSVAVNHLQIHRQRSSNARRITRVYMDGQTTHVVSTSTSTNTKDVHKYLPDVTLRSFPIASFHTRPRTLGGRPYHHRSWVFFDALLHQTSKHPFVNRILFRMFGMHFEQILWETAHAFQTTRMYSAAVLLTLVLNKKYASNAPSYATGFHP